MERQDDDGSKRYLKSELEHFIRENTALIEQRDRLVAALRGLLKDYEQTYRDLTDGQFEFSGTAIRQAQHALAAVEQGGKS